MTNFSIENLKKEIEGFRREIRAEKIGRVVEIGDGIARIYGLAEVGANEMLEFDSSGSTVSGIAFNLEEDTVGAIILGDYTNIKEGDAVRPTGRVLSVRVGEEPDFPSLCERCVAALQAMQIPNPKS